MISRALMSAMSENELQQNVLDLCKLRQLWAYHTHDARHSQKGWPDLVILGPGGALFRELKSMKGTTSHEQRDVLRRLIDAGLDASVWRPVDWLDYTIDRQLRAIA